MMEIWSIIPTGLQVALTSTGIPVDRHSKKNPVHVLIKEVCCVQYTVTGLTSASLAVHSNVLEELQNTGITIN